MLPTNVCPNGVQFWHDRVQSTRDRMVKAATGFSAETCERIWQKYGSAPSIPDREHLFWVLFDIKVRPAHMLYEQMLQSPNFHVPSNNTIVNRIERALEYLCSVAKELDPANLLNEFNHVPHFAHHVCFLVDTFPVSCLDVTGTEYQVKYADNVYKISVVTDLHGVPVHVSGPHRGSRGDQRIYKESNLPALERVLSKPPRGKMYLGLGDGIYLDCPMIITPYRKDHK